MPKAEFFTRLGLFSVKGFFTADFCAQVQAEMMAASKVPATILDQQDAYTLNQQVRKTGCAQMSDSTLNEVKSRLRSLKPDLEKHFHRSLTQLQTPQFLAYQTGDFYHPHADRCADPQVPEFLRLRQVSIVVFLNSATENDANGNHATQEPQPDRYSGGALTFYGLIADPTWQKYGFELVGELGLLIAFPSEVVHEVRPVTRGDRYTIASWFLSDPAYSNPVP